MAIMRGDGGETSSAHRGGQTMSTQLSSLTIRAREDPECRFTSLMHLLNWEFLWECLRLLKGGKAPGIDGVEIEEYEANLMENLKNLGQRLKTWKYRAQPVRRVYIPKPDGTKRGLGIPTVEDKIVQMGVKRILEAIYEQDFVDVSYGFRPARNCHQALKVLDKAIMTKPINYIVDMDIRKFFDTIDHKQLMGFLKVRIADPNLLRLIGKFLNAGVMEEGKYLEVDRGTPQGGVLSPILANIYLHYTLDLWFKKEVQPKQKGYATLIRYADDFIACFQARSEAYGFSKELGQRLAKFGLEISKEKSRIIEFGRYVWQKAQKEGRQVKTFDFLGFTHYCDKSRSGYFKLGHKTARAKFTPKLKAINQWLKDVRNLLPLKEWWKTLKLKLVGHYRYYGISGNTRLTRLFFDRVSDRAYKWINRRSQKRSYAIEGFRRFLKYNPLPEPRIYHQFYTLSS